MFKFRIFGIFLAKALNPLEEQCRPDPYIKCFHSDIALSPLPPLQSVHFLSAFQGLIETCNEQFNDGTYPALITPSCLCRSCFVLPISSTSPGSARNSCRDLHTRIKLLTASRDGISADAGCHNEQRQSTVSAPSMSLLGSVRFVPARPSVKIL